MKIWLDLANSPQVMFFLPLIDMLDLHKHRLFITLRNFNDTLGVAKMCGINAQILGKQGGRSRIMKVTNLINRSMRLLKFAKGKGIRIAISHNSYSQIIAGRLAGLRVVTLMDFEGQPFNHLAFRLAHKIIVPDSFPNHALKRFGASANKVHKYAGFKEQVYLSDFRPNQSFKNEIIDACSLPSDWEMARTILVIVRTPPIMSAYHRFENPLFEKLLVKLNLMPELTAITLPRTVEQRDVIKTKFPNLKIPKRPLNGNNLVFHSDLVISAGGTMNREAAILGTPAYTAFSGRISAVDTRLIEMGRMIALRKESDLNRIQFKKKKPRCVLKNPHLCKEIVHKILT